MRDYLESFAEGLNEGIDYWYKCIFNYKLPRWACWIVAITFLPVNIVILVMALVFDKSVINNVIQEIDEGLKETEAE